MTLNNWTYSQILVQIDTVWWNCLFSRFIPSIDWTLTENRLWDHVKYNAKYCFNNYFKHWSKMCFIPKKVTSPRAKGTIGTLSTARVGRTYPCCSLLLLRLADFAVQLPTKWRAVRCSLTPMASKSIIFLFFYRMKWIDIWN